MSHIVRTSASEKLCICSNLFPLADLKATFQLQILGVKKNPQSPMYTQLGVLTKGTVIEVNVSELGMVTAGGKVVFGKYAQITNNPENDGCINAVLREFIYPALWRFLTHKARQWSNVFFTSRLRHPLHTMYLSAYVYSMAFIWTSTASTQIFCIDFCRRL